MANDNRTNPGNPEPREQKEPSPESYPGNPNKQQQESPRQQQGESSPKRKPHPLQEGRSVTNRTVKRTIIDMDDQDDDIDLLK